MFLIYLIKHYYKTIWNANSQTNLKTEKLLWKKKISKQKLVKSGIKYYYYFISNYKALLTNNEN